MQLKNTTHSSHKDASLLLGSQCYRSIVTVYYTLSLERTSHKFHVKLVRYNPSSILLPCLLLFITSNTSYTMCKMCSTSLSNFTYLPLMGHCFIKMTVKENFHKRYILFFSHYKKLHEQKWHIFPRPITTQCFMITHYKMVVLLTPLVYAWTMLLLLTVRNWPFHKSTSFP